MVAASVMWVFGMIAVSDAPAAGGPFRELGLDQALRIAAKDRKKFVMVDFYTGWCVPCKKLDETTWRDDAVRGWLAEVAVCLKVDAEKEEALAKRYRVNSYPTVLLLKPDGSEIDRLVGYRDAKAFLADARDSLAGNNTLSRARKKLEGVAKNDPNLRMAYGVALEEKGRTQDALSEYLWCFDHGVEYRPSFAGVRISFLLIRIARLGRADPSALVELRKRRDGAMGAIEASKGDFAAAMGFSALNKTLDEPGQTLVLYDRIKGDRAQPPRVREYLFEESLELLLKAKRYKDLVSGADSHAKVRELIANNRRMLVFLPKDEELRATIRKQVCAVGARYYEGEVGVGDLPRAAGIASLLIGFSSADAYPALIEAAKRAGNADAARKLSATAPRT